MSLMAGMAGVAGVAEVTLVTGAFGQRPATAERDRAQIRANLLRLTHSADAGPVGHALLPQLSHPTAAALVVALTTRLSQVADVEISGSSSAQTLQQAFQQAVLADFAEARCCAVGGWVLTRTEAELCALTALAQLSADSA